MKSRIEFHFLQASFIKNTHKSEESFLIKPNGKQFSLAAMLPAFCVDFLFGCFSSSRS